MIINVYFGNDGVGSSYNSLPPALVKLGASDVALVELQGNLEVEGDRDGDVIGTLSLEIPVSLKVLIDLLHRL